MSGILGAIWGSTHSTAIVFGVTMTMYFLILRGGTWLVWKQFNLDTLQDAHLWVLNLAAGVALAGLHVIAIHAKRITDHFRIFHELTESWDGVLSTPDRHRTLLIKAVDDKDIPDTTLGPKEKAKKEYPKPKDWEAYPDVWEVKYSFLKYPRLQDLAHCEKYVKHFLRPSAQKQFRVLIVNDDIRHEEALVQFLAMSAAARVGTFLLKKSEYEDLPEKLRIWLRGTKLKSPPIKDLLKKQPEVNLRCDPDPLIENPLTITPEELAFYVRCGPANDDCDNIVHRANMNLSKQLNAIVLVAIFRRVQRMTGREVKDHNFSERVKSAINSADDPWADETLAGQVGRIGRIMR